MNATTLTPDDITALTQTALTQITDWVRRHNNTAIVPMVYDDGDYNYGDYDYEDDQDDYEERATDLETRPVPEPVLDADGVIYATRADNKVFALSFTVATLFTDSTTTNSDGALTDAVLYEWTIAPAMNTWPIAEQAGYLDDPRDPTPVTAAITAWLRHDPSRLEVSTARLADELLRDHSLQQDLDSLDPGGTDVRRLLNAEHLARVLTPARSGLEWLSECLYGVEIRVHTDQPGASTLSLIRDRDRAFLDIELDHVVTPVNATTWRTSHLTITGTPNAWGDRMIKNSEDLTYLLDDILAWLRA